MAEVFISYPRTERARAEIIKARLEALGVSVFFDIDGIDGGAVFPDVITRALDSAKAVLACCSPLYFTRPWCLIEAREGHHRGVFVPVMLERFERASPPADLRHVNYLNLSDWTGATVEHEDWTRTLRALGKHIGRDLIAPNAPSPPAPLPQAALGGEGRGQGEGGGVAAHLRAAEAARAGRPVAERAFPIELPGVANWPTPQMIAIPPGKFMMGAAKGEVGASDDEFPQHEVTINYSFALGQHTVTFAEWEAALGAGANLQKPSDEGWGKANRPVINVSWEDARAYLKWLNGKLGFANDDPHRYRLPSEAEWEYACRAKTKIEGATTRWAFGNEEKRLGEHAWYTANSGGKTQPVGQKASNDFGLYDMHGNVWEWCEDTWHGSYSEPGRPDDGSPRIGGNSSSRVLRGGSWVYGPQDLRSADRSGGTPTDRGSGIGFRLARTVSPP